MRNRRRTTGSGTTPRQLLAAVTVGLATLAAAELAGRQTSPADAARTAGWQLPPDAEDTKNPHPVDEKLLAVGRAVFKDKCSRCHGPGGLGDGPDADPDAREHMDLTDPGRAERNPDGIVFYKVWNGRKRPRMPAFREELTEDQVWAVVAYAQSLKKK